MTKQAAISPFAIAHQVSLRVGLSVGLALFALTTGPLLSYAVLGLLVYLLVWSAALAAPYLLGSELSAAAAQAMNQLARRVRLLRPVCYRLLRLTPALPGLTRPSAPPGWNQPLRTLSRPLVPAKTSRPFLLFPFAPLAIP